MANIRDALGVRNTFEMLHLHHETYTENDASTPEKDGGLVEKSVPMLRFSPRGKDVFMLLLEGMGNTEISKRLGMSISGVKRHREKMMLQNDCNSICELIARYHGTEGEKGATENV